MWSEEQEKLAQKYSQMFEEATTPQKKLEVLRCVPLDVIGEFSRRVSKKDLEKAETTRDVQSMNAFYNALTPEQKKEYD